MTRDEQSGATYAIKLAAIGRFVRRVLNWYRFFTPHYWRTRARRDDVAHAMQALLPAPYDPYAIELRSRSIGQAPLPGDGSSEDDSWRPVLEKLSAKALDRRLATVGAVEIGAWAVEDVHGAFAAIDQDFIAGVAHRAGATIGSFSDLSERLAPHTIAERIGTAFSGVPAKEIDALTGHVGEAVVFRHLKDAGIDDTHLATVSNQPGWDLSLDGHLVNVKTVADASGLSSHFGRYPDIAAIVPGDAAGIPSDALHFDSATGHGLNSVRDALDSGSGHVFVDSGLSHDAIHDQVQHAETLMAGGHETFEGHLPIVTMALSGYREFGLLFADKTDFATAAKNVALDATGTGVGGAVGMKAGAILGTIICPGVGTAIGGFAGAIFGAVKGREFTGEVKQRPFKEAVAAYESALAQFQSQARVHETDAEAEFNKARAAQDLRLKKRAREAKRGVEQTKQALGSWITYDSWLQPDEACALIVESSNELTRWCAAIQSRYQSIPWWRKVLWPDVGTLAQQQALAFLRRIQRKLDELHRGARNGEAVNRGELMALLGAVGVMQEQTVADLERIYAAQRDRDGQARSLIGEALSAILRERQEAEAQLSKKLEALRAAIREAMRPALTNLNNRAGCARLEGAKLGLSL